MLDNSQSFTIEGSLPSLNDIIAACHSKYRGKYNNMKKKSEATIALAIRSAGIKPVSRARFTFLWVNPNHRRDPDNISAGGRKFILDTLVSCRILTDDNGRYVLGWTDDWDYDKGHPRIEVTITECEK